MNKLIFISRQIHSIVPLYNSARLAGCGTHYFVRNGHTGNGNGILNTAECISRQFTDLCWHELEHNINDNLFSKRHTHTIGDIKWPGVWPNTADTENVSLHASIDSDTIWFCRCCGRTYAIGLLLPITVLSNNCFQLNLLYSIITFYLTTNARKALKKNLKSNDGEACVVVGLVLLSPLLACVLHIK